MLLGLERPRYHTSSPAYLALKSFVSDLSIAIVTELDLLVVSDAVSEPSTLIVLGDKDCRPFPLTPVPLLLPLAGGVAGGVDARLVSAP